jgi:hypothetical protein
LAVFLSSPHIDWSHQKIAKLADCADLAEMLFPSNRNQQHAFVAIWTALKWSPHHMVPNLGTIVRGHRVSRRTLERVRAKLRRMGLIDHVSRFNARFGGREGWVLSSRFERSLRELANKIGTLKNPSNGSREKEEMLIEFTAVRHNTASRDPPINAHEIKRGEIE